MQRTTITHILAALLSAFFWTGCLEADDSDDTDSADSESSTTTENVNGTDSETAADTGTTELPDSGSDSNTDVKGCIYNGETYDFGDVINSVAGTNCGDCVCEADGTVGCVDTECVQMCLHGDKRYSVGQSFPAGDGCNTCGCDENGDVACTEMACVPPDCANDPGKEYFEPGCGGDEGIPVITDGCYQPCDGTPCAEGICQLTDINPCICEPGMACCEACGSREYLCLDTPAECGSVSSQFAITGGGKSFGECMGECQYTFSIQRDEGSACAHASLEVCGWGADGCTRTNIGQFTPTGNALLTGLAAELMGQNIADVYGCPDCADGGASQIALIMDGVDRTVSYEFGNPPDILEKTDAFTTSVMNALNSCTSNDHIVVSNACTAAAQ